ncbi:HD family phosphohydrolase [Anaerotignum sp.]|uniref:HD family phosphohydrolase n=1 Tax=Anaerotignum sp. TaxID=2039241 RepID=UPI0028A9CBA7|nr:HDIG domain-containing metalloprotein [Anaerotignum sp.]
MEKKTKEVGIKRYSQWVLLGIAFMLTVICIGVGPYGQNEEIVQVGDVAMKRYVATRDTVDEVTTEKLKTAAANSVGPIYKNDIVVEENSTKQVNDVFQELNDLILGMNDGDDFYQKVQEASLKLPVVLSNRQLAAYQAMPLSNRILFAEDCVGILNQIYGEGLSADELEQGKEQVKAGVAATVWSTDLKGMAYTIVSAALDPNLVLDENAMETAREEKRGEVNSVWIRKNQKIVDEGEIITQDIYDRLVSLKLIGDAKKDGNLIPFLGSTTIVALIFGAVILLFLWNKGAAVLKKNEVRMLFCVYTIMVLLCKAMVLLPYYSLIPLCLFAMLVSILIGRRMALLMNCFFSIIACMIFSGDVEFITYALISGSFGALMIQKTERRAHMVPVAVGMAIVNFVAMFAVGLFFRDGYTTELAIASGLGALMGLIAVVIAVGSLPFWEGVFEANTPLRLLELTNPNNELLRRLMIEAPGTYHHSLIVANLAETAVYEIGGNTALARAGAYYHDVGKLKYPMFFAENQSGHNPHDDLDPKASARIITQHTKAGVELGIEYGIPKVILNIMKEHHGTSLVKYFYFKALKTYGAENVVESDYRYDGQVPSSRESAVVMLADTVEAAVRAMLGNGKTLDDVEEFVKGLIKDKLDDEQLNRSGLAIHELEIIRKAFLKVFHGMYHERVSYPKKEDIEAASRKTKIGKEEKSSDNTD